MGEERWLGDNEILVTRRLWSYPRVQKKAAEPQPFVRGKGYLWYLKTVQAQETWLIESPGSFWPGGLKCRKRRSPDDVFAFCVIHLVAGERGQIYPRVGSEWAKDNKNELLSLTALSPPLLFLLWAEETKGWSIQATSLAPIAPAFLAFQLGSPSSYHFNPINAEYTVRHGTKLR